MAIRTVIQIGHSALKAKNKKIGSFTSAKTKKLLKDLKNTMKKTGLVGIAAPQISENYMVFLTHPRNTKARKLPKTDKLRIYINPKVTYLSKSKNILTEGCGSVIDGGLFGPVKRPKEVEVQAYDENGKRFSLRCDGILAAIIQHEIDHLQGIEFITKVYDYKKIVNHEFYVKKIRNTQKEKKASKITKIEYKKF